MSFGKLILLLIAMWLVVLVLLLGYKLDKYEENRKRKIKDTKKHDNKEDNSYVKPKTLKNKYEEEQKQTDIFGNIDLDFNKESSKNNNCYEKNNSSTMIFDTTAVKEEILANTKDKKNQKQ